MVLSSVIFYQFWIFSKHEGIYFFHMIIKLDIITIFPGCNFLCAGSVYQFWCWSSWTSQRQWWGPQEVCWRTIPASPSLWRPAKNAGAEEVPHGWHEVAREKRRHCWWWTHSFWQEIQESLKTKLKVVILDWRMIWFQYFLAPDRQTDCYYSSKVFNKSK